ncbi:MAG TPA: hypothetical protein VFY44_01935 [Thermoleophilaceae bacterium]|nr:hypothetical protein [Thermoleophilaceae bacterium]
MAAKKPKTGADALDEVYLGDFEGFVARRDALAKQLRADGDGDEADRVKALKKPSRTAWAVNQFAANGKKLRNDLLKAGGRLREASEGLVSGDADREAMLKARDGERAAVGAALKAIAALAAESGPELNAAATERVRQTLHAVALDDEVREQFEAARLTTDHEASGLGAGGPATAAGGGAAKAKPATAAKKKGRDREAERKRRRRDELKAAEAEAAKRDRDLKDADLELAEAKKAAKRAQGDLKRATTRQEKAKAAADDAAAKVQELG